MFKTIKKNSQLWFASILNLAQSIYKLNNSFRYDTSLADACAALAKKWSSVKEDPDLAQFSGAEIENMSPYQVREFLGQLLEEVMGHVIIFILFHIRSVRSFICTKYCFI